MINETLNEADQKMDKAVEVTREDFAAIRTGRAHPSMFQKITADYYGTPTPLQQLASFTVPEARVVIVAPYDMGSMAAIEKAIRDSDLGVNPTNDGKIIRLPIPPLNEERRKQLAKQVHEIAEEHRIAVRNVRHSSNDTLKKMLKDKEVSEDEERFGLDEVQKLTNNYIGKIDELAKNKEAEIMSV